jgi:hypothetical protein
MISSVRRPQCESAAACARRGENAPRELGEKTWMSVKDWGMSLNPVHPVNPVLIPSTEKKTSAVPRFMVSAQIAADHSVLPCHRCHLWLFSLPVSACSAYSAVASAASAAASWKLRVLGVLRGGFRFPATCSRPSHPPFSRHESFWSEFRLQAVRMGRAQPRPPGPQNPGQVASPPSLQLR